MRSTACRARSRRRSTRRWRTTACRSPSGRARAHAWSRSSCRRSRSSARPRARACLTTPLRDRFGIQARLEPYSVAELAMHRAPLGGHPRDRARGGRRAGDRGAQPRHAARGQPAAQARARLRRGAHGGRRHGRGRARRAGDARGRRARPRSARPRDPARRSAPSSRAGRSGLSTLAVAVGEEQDTIEDVYEPYLLQEGLHQAHPARARRDPRGLRAPGPRAARARPSSRCSEAA